ncbi:MAG TPA: ABC transporter permease [Puia sp.]|nr:ABC transporter permease [Puia sp.]
MLKNYFKTAWRNLLHNKVYSLIAVIGLAIGLAVSVLLFWGVNDELTYDTQLADAPDIYKVNARIKMGNDNYETWTSTPAPTGAFALKELPAVREAVRISGGRALVTLGDKHLYENDIAYTEPSFFDLFRIRFISGNSKTALAGPDNIVLSRTAAIKYFGSAAAAEGKTLLLGEKLKPYKISAIIEDMPQQSSVRRDVLMSLDVVRQNFGGNGNWKTIDEDWGDFGFLTFLKLRHGSNVSSLEQQLTAMHIKNNSYVKTGDVTYIFQPLNTLRLYNPDLSPAGIKVVRFFILVGVLILLIAVINYINLSTARATRRAKEVGLRRVIGADRKQLIIQFILEFVLIFLASLVLAAALMPILIPIYKSISGKSYPIDLLQPATFKIIGWVGLGTIVSASIYPAWVLSSFNPTETLKATFNKTSRGGWLRKGLVVLQFTFSIVLIICTIVILGQLHFIQKKNLGYNRENIIIAGVNNNMGKNLPAIMEQLRANKSIADVTFSTDNLLNMGSFTDNIDWPGKNNPQAHISPMEVAPNFTTVMQMKFAAGEGFTGTPADTGYYLVNESAVRMMDLQHPIGTAITLWGHTAQIRGVMKDFNNGSLKTSIRPTIFRAALNAEYGGVLYVKAYSEQAKEAVSGLEKIHHQYNPIRPFEYQFMDDNFDAMYRKETQTAQLFKSFAGVAILLSCLGLFGLAVFTAERRTKEIGIRKVLGASVRHISVLISSEFSWLVLIANIIAWPVAWYLAHEWLRDFTYRISITWWIFLLAGAISLLLAIITVSSQAIRAALANPVKSLKRE